MREPVGREQVGGVVTTSVVEVRREDRAAVHRVGQACRHAVDVAGEVPTVVPEEPARRAVEVPGLEQPEDHGEQ